MDVDNIAVAGIVSAILTATVTYLLTTRQTSGQIGHTDADRLWEQNMMLITAYAKDNGALRERCDFLEKRVHTAEERERECNEKSYVQQRQLERLERMVSGDAPIVEEPGAL